MRPGVQATVLRSRVKRVRRSNPDEPHRFSLRRLLLLVFIGTVIFISGIALTVLGYQKGPPDPTISKDQLVMYRALGPIGCVVGSALLLGAAMYYYCFGTGDGYGPRPPQSPATSTSYHPISSIRSTSSNSHRHHHHGNHSHHSHHGHHHHDNHHHDHHQGATAQHYPDLEHHQLIMAAGAAPLAAMETGSIRDTPSAVPSEISIAVEDAHSRHGARHNASGPNTPQK